MTLIEVLLSCRGKSHSEREEIIGSLGVPASLWSHIQASFDKSGNFINSVGEFLRL